MLTLHTVRYTSNVYTPSSTRSLLKDGDGGGALSDKDKVITLEFALDKLNIDLGKPLVPLSVCCVPLHVCCFASHLLTCRLVRPLYRAPSSVLCVPAEDTPACIHGQCEWSMRHDCATFVFHRTPHRHHVAWRHNTEAAPSVHYTTHTPHTYSPHLF